MKITEAEIAAMAALLHLPEFDFIQTFTRLRMDRRGLSLVEKPDGECVFLDGITCRVHAAKPRQCLEFPNGWAFEGFEKVCQAVPQSGLTIRNFNH